jgi:LysM repeat protein
MQRSRAPRSGPEGYVLVLALLTPLLVVGIAVAQLLGLNLSGPSSMAYADSPDRLVTSRPAPSNPAPPPTLVPPTPTVKPTDLPTPAPTAQQTAAAQATPANGRSYTVQRGDELKQIAAQYGVSIWTIINSNNIPNPDSLRVGQVLTIPNS